MNRRQFLYVGLASVSAACGRLLPQHGSGREPAPIADRNVAAASAVRRIVAERVDPVVGRCRYLAHVDDRPIGQPILIARHGDRFDAVIENALPQPTTIHFHGLTIPEAQDGAGFDPIAPGAEKRLHFEVRNRSGLYWFHPHAHGFTAEQIHAGLVGLLIVTDDNDEALDAALMLPARNRLALIVADARTSGSALQPYAPSAADCTRGWYGNAALVNGQLGAHWDVAPGWVRLQILNACNARGLLLAFRDGADLLPYHLLGTDGGLLNAPRAVDRVFLYSAERVDVAIDLTGRPGATAVTLAFDPRHQMQGTAPHHGHPARDDYPSLAQSVSLCEQPSDAAPAAPLPDGAELELFTLKVSGAGTRAAPALPSRLAALSDTAQPTGPTRRMRLDFDEQRGFLIDQTPYRRDEIAFSVNRGTREVWEIKNSPISMPHPMHLHGFGFRVLRRQGTYGGARRLATETGSRLPTDVGIKDTVVVWPNETLWLEVDFTLPDDGAFRGRQRYMFHCHNLEHEDGMMMRNFAVV